VAGVGGIGRIRKCGEIDVSGDLRGLTGPEELRKSRELPKGTSRSRIVSITRIEVANRRPRGWKGSTIDLNEAGST
jgi:hypothetical protein